MAIVVVVIVLLALSRFGIVTMGLRFTARRDSALLRAGAVVRTTLLRYTGLFRSLVPLVPLVRRGWPILVGAAPGLLAFNGLLRTLILRCRPALVAITPLPGGQ
jgi:hypothetical protein